MFVCSQVKLSCGMHNEVRSASEPNRCEYEYTFTTPAVCSQIPVLDDKDPFHDELSGHGGHRGVTIAGGHIGLYSQQVLMFTTITWWFFFSSWDFVDTPMWWSVWKLWNSDISWYYYLRHEFVFHFFKGFFRNIRPIDEKYLDWFTTYIFSLFLVIKICKKKWREYECFYTKLNQIVSAISYHRSLCANASQMGVIGNIRL